MKGWLSLMISLAEKLFTNHNLGKIHITKITTERNNVLLDNIPETTKLFYNHTNRILTYIDADGTVNNITLVYHIDKIFYTGNLDDDSDDQSDFNNTNENVCPCGEDCSCDCGCCDIDTFPNSEIKTRGYSANGLIFPYTLNNGTLIYDCALGDIREGIKYQNAGELRNDTDTFKSFFGMGYVNLNYGKLIMNIYIPEDGFYSIQVRTGAENCNGKRSIIFLNNTEYFIRTNSEQRNKWQIVKPEKYNNVTEDFNTVSSVKLHKGTNVIELRIDPNRGTINVSYDCIALVYDSSKPIDLDEDDCLDDNNTKFKHLQDQINLLKDDIHTLSESLKHTFITVNNINELFNIPVNQMIEGRLFKVNDIGNNKSAYYVYGVNGFEKFNFDDPRAFITLNNYKELLEFSENKNNLVHGKLVKINRPNTEDINDITIEEPNNYYKPAYYYYDSIGEKWLLFNFGEGGNNSSNINISENDIPDNSISTSKLKDSSVTSSKIEDGSITNSKLEDGSVTINKLASGVIPKIIAMNITLNVDGWDAETNSQTIDIEDLNIIDIIISSVKTDQILNNSTWCIYCSAQDTNSITFTCKELPEVDVIMNIVIIKLTISE